MEDRKRATQTGGNRHTNKNVAYLHGSAAPKHYDPVPQRKSHRETTHKPQQHRQTAPRSNPASIPMVALSILAFSVIAVMMIQYIRLNSEIVALTTGNAKLESQINELRIENDEYYSRIINSVDLEKVREIAIMDLGMVYAGEEQIITYDSQIDDYVEQSRVIGD